MTSTRRAAVVVVVVATATLALSAAAVEAGEGKDPAVGGVARDGDPEMLTWPAAEQAPVGEPLARLIPAPDWREVAQAGEPRVPRAHHPVAGSFDYGDSGAVFGAPRSDHIHEGQDMFASAGTPLVAVRDGVVVEAGSDAGRGNHVAIHSEEAEETYVYFHLIEPAPVAVGERVRGGDEVGRLGCTGSCFGDHLHFEVHRGEDAEAPAVDPLPLLQSWE